jgi:hypothetical protein
MLGVPRVPDFKIPNSESGMGYGPVREILARGWRGRTSSVSPGRTLGVLGGAGDRQGRKEWNRVDAEFGQQKTPQGEPYGAAKGGGWPTRQPFPARAERTIRATKKAPRRR